MALSLVKNLSKVAIGAGAVYITVDQGLWGDAAQGPVTVKRLSNTLPAQKDYFEKIPSSKQVGDYIRDNWNYGVQKTFGAVADSPQSLREAVQKYIKKS
ncbi:MICOS complex subunit MIC13-like [Ptychodera flava]|uniref:MICOS complex subunit MIC13-like n=1 Tax=Ptychodera flava TaxID=63121 RepID=UPI00396A9195